MNGAPDILQVVERLYAAALSPEHWPGAMEAAAGLVGGNQGVLLFNSAVPGEAPVAVSAGVDPRLVARGMTPEGSRLLAPLVTHVPIGVSNRAALMPDREFERSGCYNEIIRPMNGFHSLQASNVGAAGAFILTICRPRRAENFEAAEMAMLGALAPHLSAALDLRQRLRAAEQRHEGFERALDRLADGVILTDAAARPLFVNARAARIAAAADGLILDAGGLMTASPAATKRLRETIAATSRDDAVEARRIRIERPSHRPPLLLTVLPIWRLGIALAGQATPRAAIFIAEPDAPRAIDRRAIAEIFRLTPRESEIAVLLAGGADLVTIAERLGLGIGTVRDHLKHVFEKSGARNQAALVALLRGFVDPAS